MQICSVKGGCESTQIKLKGKYHKQKEIYVQQKFKDLDHISKMSDMNAGIRSTDGFFLGKKIS